MSSNYEENFESANAGASKTYPVQCSTLRKGGYVMIKDRPCRIVEMSTSKTGKHGHAKVHLVALDIFTEKKLEDLCPSTHNMDVPVVKKIDYQFMYLEEPFLALMDGQGNSRNDVRMPEDPLILAELKSRIEKDDEFMVTVLSACDTEVVSGFKTVTK